MHPSARAHMARLISTYVPKRGKYTVIDFGSRASDGETVTHRDLFERHRCTIIGVDIKEGNNVDVVMKQPYRLPMRANSADVVISGQVFEHIPFFWASLLEIARVLRPGGYFLMTAPSRGHAHTAVDCWRIYPDGVRAMAAFAGLELFEASTDFPPRAAKGRRHDYAAIDVADRYWGDTVGVFRKPTDYPNRRMALVRGPVLWWANRIPNLAPVQAPPARRRRRRKAQPAT